MPEKARIGMSQELQGTSESPVPREAARARILLAVLTAVAIYLCWRTLQPFATVLLWAMVLALMFGPSFAGSSPAPAAGTSPPP